LMEQDQDGPDLTFTQIRLTLPLDEAVGQQNLSSTHFLKTSV
jgi:hypothetical protein